MDYSPIAAPAHSGRAGVSARPTPKNVKFELVSQDSPQCRARLPMRVQIYPHDTTDSIVTTVKNFYGLYSSPTSSKGVSFEDEQGNTLIARHENFRDNMVVYVRVIEEAPPTPSSFAAHSFQPTTAPAGAQPYYSADGYPLQAPPQFAPQISRPASRTSRKRSPSPNSVRGRRSASTSTNPKARSRSAKNRGQSSHGAADIPSDPMNGYSSGDGAPGSVSGKNKDQIGNTEISLENIVEGGRRKRPKFESSELPLFAPPQMPAATSNPSVSPARRGEHQRPSLPFVAPGQNPFTHPRPLQSPQSYHNGYSMAGMYATPIAESRRHRGSIGYPAGVVVGPGMAILPTPDPTVGSCMSEEDKDVAIQLMRLGDLSNISHGRTSASTLDETFSGRADAASSTGATSDSDGESDDGLPAARRQKLDSVGIYKKVFQHSETHFVPVEDSAEASGDDAEYEFRTEQGLGAATANAAKLQKPTLPSGDQSGIPRPRVQSATSKPKAPKPIKANGPPSTKSKKTSAISSGPMSPASLPASRKQSIASNATFPTIAGEDDQPDLSTKPRCQRCRKSKKGCDRQRPCGRCRDAGIPAELCISEDEGNGRKGRYGRHMGVPVKKEEVPPPPALLPAAPIAASLPTAASMYAADPKKRKR